MQPLNATFDAHNIRRVYDEEADSEQRYEKIAQLKKAASGASGAL